jgi:hypothetical protein
MNEEKYFECLGEIWRDVTAIEFLMRCAVAKYNGEESKFPLPPYTKGKIYDNPPKIFLEMSFGKVMKKFNELFPDIYMPEELKNLRNAMAHGVIASVNGKTEQLIKFKKNNEDKVLIEFSLLLELRRLEGIRISVRNLRIHVMQKINNM